MVKTKVCHLTSVHLFTDPRIFLKECKSLEQGGYEVHLIAPNAPTEKISGIHVHGINKEVSSRISRMINRGTDVYKKALEIDADIYQFHDPELLLVGLWLKIKGKKVIYDVHEDVPRQILSKYWIPKILRKTTSISIELIEQIASRYFDFIITATPYLKDRFKKYNINTIDINNFPMLAEFQHVSHSNRDFSAKSVCYVGSITKVRGIVEMVKALEKTEVTLLLGGKFSSIDEKKEVEKLEGWKRVKELGHIDRENVMEVFSNSIAGLIVPHPIINYLDAIPTKMFEYMLSGLPVIGARLPMIQGFVEKYRCGLIVDPLSPQEISNAIKWILNNPQEAKRMGENGREIVLQKYNWEKESEKLIAVYKTLDEKRGRGGGNYSDRQSK